MNTTFVLNKPGGSVTGSLLPAAILVVAAIAIAVYVKRPRSAVGPIASAQGGEEVLRSLVTRIGAVLGGRGISEETELDAEIAVAQREAFERRYTSSHHA